MNIRYEFTDSLNQPMEAFYHVSDGSNFPILPHWHYFIEIIYLINGKIEATCDDAVYTLLPGDLIIFCPQKIHSIDYAETAPFSGINRQKNAWESRLYSDSASPKINTTHHAIYPILHAQSNLEKGTEAVEYMVLKFDINFLNAKNSYKNRFLNTLTYAFQKDPKHIFFSKEQLKNTPVSALMADCISEMQKQEYGCDTIAGSLTAMLLTKLMRLWVENGLVPDEIIRESTADNKEFEEITQYIEEHFNEPLQVQDLASHCHMSYSYFAKKFRKIYNQSCKDYIEFVRINKVLDLLRFTTFDLTYISQETGFSDCSHLIRTFKKRMGMPPKQWQKKLREDTL